MDKVGRFRLGGTDWVGDCYVAAYKYIESRVDSEADDHQLVHGIVTRKTLGGHTAHAWVERHSDSMVIDPSNGRVTTSPILDYYATYGIEVVARYTPNDAAWKMLSSCHYGPWTDDGGNRGSQHP